MMLHPGGATPVTQTVDTDLNQHVKREYSVLESLAILDHMRKGMSVPKLDPTECVDMMVKVCPTLGCISAQQKATKKPVQLLHSTDPKTI